MLCRAPNISAGPTYTWEFQVGVASALPRRPSAMICVVLFDDGRNRTDKTGVFKRNILGAEEGKINDH
jgi:hypothetical protein